MSAAVAGQRRNPVARQVARYAEAYLRAYRNNNHRAARNGEGSYLARLPRGTVSCAFDVGGFRGEWSGLLLAAHPSAHVHCFEITPETAAALADANAGDSRVTVNRFGLAPADGERTLFVDDEATDTNSLVQHRTRPVHSLVVPVRSGDSYAAEHHVRHIDVLKIDTEGFDIEVLKGFSGLLAAGAITVIQFEYNEWNLMARVLLADFYDLLEPLGYTIGKVHPSGIDFQPYSHADETWVGPACVAVRRDRTDLITALR